MQENENDSSALAIVLAKLANLEQRDVEQRIINVNLDNKIASQQDTIQKLTAKLRHQEAENKVQKRYIEEHENLLMTYEKTMTIGKGASSKTPTPEVRGNRHIF